MQPTKTDHIKYQLTSFYSKNESKLEIAFFVGGFLFDLLTLSNVDDLFSVSQQIIYLIIIAAFLIADVLVTNQKMSAPTKLGKIWEYRQLIVHFLFGSLLSVYSIFYFKSSSVLSSFVFIIFMSIVLIANEVSRVKNAGHWLKFSMYALCLNAFFSIIYPVILGFIGWIPFILSVLTTLGIFFLISKFLLKKNIELLVIRKQFFVPAIGIQIFFVLFYVLGWIPPVPLSAKYMGIYHKLEKVDGVYKLYHEKPFWKFWQNGDQTFYSRAREPIYFFANIYSPARFADQVNIRWMYYDTRLDAWQTTDLVPMKIVGGRQDGFRGYVYKSNYQEGDWRVQIETTDGREIGRIYFSVHADDSIDEREFKSDEK